MATDPNFLDFASDALGVFERISRVATRQPGPPVASVVHPVGVDARSRTAEFSIVEAIDADSGAPVFVVKNARGDRAVCSSRDFARRVRDRLG
jgi:hypothetical protein